MLWKQPAAIFIVFSTEQTSKTMKSIFDAAAYNELLNRIDALNKNLDPLWGKMTVGQMVWHCQIPLKVAIKNKKYGKKGNPLIKFFFKKSLYSDKPLRKHLPTSPMAKATEEKDFAIEVKKLRAMVDQVHLTKDRKEWQPHPIFGEFTHDQWGQLEYKHLDHHLQQFGV